MTEQTPQEVKVVEIKPPAPELPAKFSCKICTKGYHEKSHPKIDLCKHCWNVLVAVSAMIKKEEGMRYVLTIIDAQTKEFQKLNKIQLIR